MAQIVAMSHANPYGGKARLHFSTSSFLPCYPAQVTGTQAQGKIFGGEWLVLPISSQPPLRTPPLFFRLRRQGVDFGGPKRGLRLNTNRVEKLQRYEPFAETAIVAVGGIGQHHAARHTLVHQRTYLVERDLRLGLKSDLFGYARLLAPLLVVCPGLGKIEAIGGRNAGLFGGQRDAYCYTAVLQFAQLTAVLTGNSHRMSPFWGNSVSSTIQAASACFRVMAASTWLRTCLNSVSSL